MADVEKNNRGQADGRTDREAVGGRNGKGQINGQSVDVEKNKRGYADGRTDRRTVGG